MNWLNPGLSVIAGVSGRVRTVGEPETSERDAARFQRHRIATAGRKPSRAAYFRAYNKRPARRSYLTAKKREYRSVA